MSLRFFKSIHWALPLCLLLSVQVAAHPTVENALDIVIAADRVVIDARISMEQILVAAGKSSAVPPRETWPQFAAGHLSYVKTHLQVRADGRSVSPTTAVNGTLPALLASSTQLIPFHLEYALNSPPRTVRVDQNFLREFDLWTASCVVRIRQIEDATFSTALLTRENSAEYDCVWNTASANKSNTAIRNPSIPETRPTRTNAALGSTIRAYVKYGIMHILTGYDHLLFASALVLATTRLSDLIKVVTAFTVAHTLTLIWSVSSPVALVSERVVEPMIAASIVFVALQNIFWPRQSRGWTRLAIAFGFGLFHGLGFAGGLKEAMSEMPRTALWAALASFSLGVELGHQVVVLPLFIGMKTVRGRKSDTRGLMLSRRLIKTGSLAISIAGVYFLIHSFR